jgi:hypothetical protein
LKAASACVAWESSASRLNRDENSQSQPNHKYALTAARILVHYMMNGGFLGGRGEANRDNNYILDHVHRIKDILVHSCMGVTIGCVTYITTAGHSSLEPETNSRLCTIMNDLPPMNPFDRGGK